MADPAIGGKISKRHVFWRAFFLCLLMGVTARAEIWVSVPLHAMVGQSLRIQANGLDVVRWEVRIGAARYEREGPFLNLAVTPREPGAMELFILAVDGEGNRRLIEQTVECRTPRQALIEAWVEAVAQDDGALNRADSVTAPGQCKQYLINVFERISADYAWAASPDVPLFMPARPNDPEQSGRVAGTGWELPPAESGNPFVEAARYDYQGSATLRENRRMARALLEQAQPGDVLQMMAIYNNGVRGTHTLLVTQPYDAERDYLYWSDSNFRMRTVEGVRYAYVVARQERGLEEIIDWLVNPACGATLYRLDEGIAHRPQ